MRRYIIFFLLGIFTLFIIGCNSDKISFNDELQSTSDGADVSKDLTEDSSSDDIIMEPIIVWLGDSLTQGSLGDIDDNLANAPTVTLAAIMGCEVEGYGFYGNTTHDVLWRYQDETQENQTIDPKKTYVFWLGANDWVGESVNTDTENVISQLDHFIEYGNISRYIVIGTIARKELRTMRDGRQLCEIIDDDLQRHYGDRFLEVKDVIGSDGYGPDDIHLRQESYDNVAIALRDKLINMGWFNN